ncbi:TIGR03086 family metal-binding protein [Nocardioides sp.]|uniref:TIGR03086 family metal-binding protein n=1 Tax=Nocardioides sp. TaxID=35761 RepID=UPI002ED2D9CA
MSSFDLAAATQVTADVVFGVDDDQLSDRTPCPEYTVADLLDHVHGLSIAFAEAARKTAAGAAPSPDGSRLGPKWRDDIIAALGDLAAAWREPGAFEGVTMAGPVEMPGDAAALVALNEVVVHGWDLARATAQTYDPDPGAVVLCREFVASFEAPANDDGGLFGPPVDVEEDASDLHMLLGATGRRPDWTP